MQLVAAAHTGYIRDPKTLLYPKKSTPSVVFGYSISQIQTDIQALDRESLADLPQGVQGAYQWIDLDGEGLPGMSSQQGSALFYKQNLGGGDLAPARLLLRQPSVESDVDADRGAQLVDDGQGLLDGALFRDQCSNDRRVLVRGGMRPARRIAGVVEPRCRGPGLWHPRPRPDPSVISYCLVTLGTIEEKMRSMRAPQARSRGPDPRRQR